MVAGRPGHHPPTMPAKCMHPLAPIHLIATDLSLCCAPLYLILLSLNVTNFAESYMRSKSTSPKLAKPQAKDQRLIHTTARSLF